jgi:2-polyprenyl-3-methyl-5-hydroxy-6-metoxy-1,4-benzoquinol methylase
MWLDPKPLEQEISKFYQNYHEIEENPPIPQTWLRRAYLWITKAYLAYKYDGYQSDRFSDWEKWIGLLVYLHPGRRADLDFSVMYLPAKVGSRLLDVGCGNGGMLKRMQGLGWCVEGVDFDPVAVENAKGKGLDVRLGTLETQGYPENHFDVITLSHLIEHVHDPLRLLLECRRILRPHGRLLLVTPNNGSWGHRIFGETWLHLDPPRHFHIFNLPSIRHLITKAGFQEPRLSTIIRDASGTFIASRSIRHKRKHKRSVHQPRSTQIWGRMMQFLEWGILKINPNAGEEILLLADK